MMMPDREKAIKGLEHCGLNEKRGCVGCPYSDECGDFGRDAGMSSLATDALALLREQEPVEPTATDEAIRVKYNCGECGYLVGFVSTIHDDMQYRAKFCPECGKRVKWDG